MMYNFYCIDKISNTWIQYSIIEKNQCIIQQQTFLCSFAAKVYIKDELLLLWRKRNKLNLAATQDNTFVTKGCSYREVIKKLNDDKITDKNTSYKSLNILTFVKKILKM